MFCAFALQTPLFALLFFLRWQESALIAQNPALISPWKKGVEHRGSTIDQLKNRIFYLIKFVTAWFGFVEVIWRTSSFFRFVLFRDSDGSHPLPRQVKCSHKAGAWTWAHPKPGALRDTGSTGQMVYNSSMPQILKSSFCLDFVWTVALSCNPATHRPRIAFKVQFVPWFINGESFIDPFCRSQIKRFPTTLQTCLSLHMVMHLKNLSMQTYSLPGTISNRNCEGLVAPLVANEAWILAGWHWEYRGVLYQTETA